MPIESFYTCLCTPTTHIQPRLIQGYIMFGAWIVGSVLAFVFQYHTTDYKKSRHISTAQMRLVRAGRG